MTAAALDVTRQFVDAIAWGEHRTVWELLSPGGRTTVLRVATRRGMDEALGARLRDGQATKGDEERFLADLVNGLRADLAGTDLDALELEADPVPAGDDRTWILLVAPVPAALGVPGLPVGSIELAKVDGAWRVERLAPRAVLR